MVTPCKSPARTHIMSTRNTPQKRDAPGSAQKHDAPGSASKAALSFGRDKPKEGKRRKSMRGRRVSFAPDHEMETVHIFRAQEAGAGSSQKVAAPVLEQPTVAAHPVIVQQLASEQAEGTQQFALAPTSVPDSPAPAAGAGRGDVTVPMDITGMTDEASSAAAAVAAAEDLAGSGGVATSSTWELQRFSARQAAQLAAAAGPGEKGVTAAGAGADVTLNVTAGVPRLGSLLREDEDDAGDQAPAPEELRAAHASIADVSMDLSTGPLRTGGPCTAAADDVGGGVNGAGSNNNNATEDLSLGYGGYLQAGAHPAWGSAADSTAALVGGPSAACSPATSNGGAGLAGGSGGGGPAGAPGGYQQASKWGFVPGGDDTTDLNPGALGVDLLGERTYNQIYGAGADQTGNVTLMMHGGGGPSSSPDTPRMLLSAAMSPNPPGSAMRAQQLLSNAKGQQQHIAAPSPLISNARQLQQQQQHSVAPSPLISLAPTPKSQARPHWVAASRDAEESPQQPRQQEEPGKQAVEQWYQEDQVEEEQHEQQQQHRKLVGDGEEEEPAATVEQQQEPAVDEQLQQQGEVQQQHLLPAIEEHELEQQQQMEEEVAAEGEEALPSSQQHTDVPTLVMHESQAATEVVASTAHVAASASAVHGLAGMSPSAYRREPGVVDQPPVATVAAGAAAAAAEAAVSPVARPPAVVAAKGVAPVSPALPAAAAVALSPPLLTGALAADLELGRRPGVGITGSRPGVASGVLAECAGGDVTRGLLGDEDEEADLLSPLGASVAMQGMRRMSAVASAGKHLYGGGDLTMRLLLDETADGNDPMAELHRKMSQLQQQQYVVQPQQHLGGSPIPPAAPRPDAVTVAAAAGAAGYGQTDSCNPNTGTLPLGGGGGGTTRLLASTQTMAALPMAVGADMAMAQPMAPRASLGAAQGRAGVDMETALGGTGVDIMGAAQSGAGVDMTMASVAGKPFGGGARGSQVDEKNLSGGSLDLMAGAAGGVVGAEPGGGVGGGCRAGGLLEDHTMDDLEPPPELPEEWRVRGSGCAAKPAATPAKAPAAVEHRHASEQEEQRHDMRHALAAAADAPLPQLDPASNPIPPGSMHRHAPEQEEQEEQHQHMRQALAAATAAPLPQLEPAGNHIPSGSMLPRSPLGAMDTNVAVGGPGASYHSHSKQRGKPPQAPLSAVHAATVAHTPLALTPAAAAHSHGVVPRRTPLSARLVVGTPLHSRQAVAMAQPISFQEFLKVVDIQFLDHMRRGTSIHPRDLASDPPPRSLAESYHLLALVNPDINEIEGNIQLLKEEIQSRKDRILSSERQLSASNPAIFRDVQTVGPEELEACRAGLLLLKKACRARAHCSWKEWRADVQRAAGARLQQHLQNVRGDAEYLQAGLGQLRKLRSAFQSAKDVRRGRMQKELDDHKSLVEQHKRVELMRRELHERQAENAERRSRLVESQARLADAQERLQGLAEQSQGLQQRLVELQNGGGDGQKAGRSAGQEQQAEAVLAKLRDMDRSAECHGWSLESMVAEGEEGDATAATDLCLRFGQHFQLRIRVDGQHGERAVSGMLELAADGGAAKAKPYVRQLAQAMLMADTGPCLPPAEGLQGQQQQGGTVGSFEVPAGPDFAARLAREVGRCGVRVGRLMDLSAELDRLLLTTPHLADVACERGSNGGGAVRLKLLNLSTGLLMSARLGLAPSYPFGTMSVEATVRYPGSAKVTEQQVAEAVAQVPAGFNRLTAVARALSNVAAQRPPEAAEAGAPAGSLFSNPLFAGIEA